MTQPDRPPFRGRAQRLTGSYRFRPLWRTMPGRWLVAGASASATRVGLPRYEPASAQQVAVLVRFAIRATADSLARVSECR